MSNNYTFQRLLATFDLSRNHDLINHIFELGGQHKELSKSSIKAWRTHDASNRNYRPMPDGALNNFFDGLQAASISGIITIYLDEDWCDD